MDKEYKLNKALDNLFDCINEESEHNPETHDTLRHELIKRYPHGFYLNNNKLDAVVEWLLRSASLRKSTPSIE